MFKLLSFFTFIVYLMEAHIHATWRIRLNEPSAAAMRPYVELLWPLVVKIASHLDQQLSRDDVTRGCRGNAVHAVRFTRITRRFWGRLQNEDLVVYTVLDVGYSYIRRDVVCLSVCLRAGHNCELCKTSNYYYYYYFDPGTQFPRNEKKLR